MNNAWKLIIGMTVVFTLLIDQDKYGWVKRICLEIRRPVRQSRGESSMIQEGEWQGKKAQITQILEGISNDTGTPRNIRRTAKNAADELDNEKLSPPVRAANAIEMVNEILSDPNMPSWTRTALWSAISLLETVRR